MNSPLFCRKLHPGLALFRHYSLRIVLKKPHFFFKANLSHA